MGNSRILQDFEWFSWYSGQNSQNFGEIHRLPVNLTKHFLQDVVYGGCVDIFWNSPIQVSSLVIQTYFIYENSFLVVNFTLDQTRVPFWSFLLLIHGWLSSNVLIPYSKPKEIQRRKIKLGAGPRLSYKYLHAHILTNLSGLFIS